MAVQSDILILQETWIPVLLSVLYIRKKVRSVSVPELES